MVSVFMNQNNKESISELNRRHKTAAVVVGAFLGLALALIGIAFAFGEQLYRPGDRTFAIALWTLILILSIGAIIFRRVRFAISRINDVAVLRGASGILKDMQSTTIVVASMGGAAALLGFIVMIRTGDEYQMLRSGLVAIFVLLYSYPQKSAWLRVLQWLEKKNSAS